MRPHEFLLRPRPLLIPRERLMFLQGRPRGGPGLFRHRRETCISTVAVSLAQFLLILILLAVPPPLLLLLLLLLRSLAGDDLLQSLGFGGAVVIEKGVATVEGCGRGGGA